MSKSKNEAIGEVECAQKGCSLKAPVFRFQARGSGSTRFAGKLYSVCPTHGRYGGDGKPAAQDYILENATIWGNQAQAPVATGPAPVTAPTAPVASPVTAPVAAPVTPATKHWSEAFAPLLKL